MHGLNRAHESNQKDSNVSSLYKLTSLAVGSVTDGLWISSIQNFEDLGGIASVDDDNNNLFTVILITCFS